MQESGPLGLEAGVKEIGVLAHVFRILWAEIVSNIMVSRSLHVAIYSVIYLKFTSKSY